MRSGLFFSAGMNPYELESLERSRPLVPNTRKAREFFQRISDAFQRQCEELMGEKMSLAHEKEELTEEQISLAQCERALEAICTESFDAFEIEDADPKELRFFVLESMRYQCGESPLEEIVERVTKLYAKWFGCTPEEGEEELFGVDDGDGEEFMHWSELSSSPMCRDCELLAAIGKNILAGMQQEDLGLIRSSLRAFSALQRKIEAADYDLDIIGDFFPALEKFAQRLEQSNG